MWLSLVERHVRDVEAASSNLVTSIIEFGCRYCDAVSAFLCAGVRRKINGENYVCLARRVGKVTKTVTISLNYTTYRIHAVLFYNFL